MNIVLVGHVCIDRNISEGASYVNWGSALMHMAYYLRTELNIDPVLITNYGKDFESYIDGFHMIPPKPSIKRTLVIENHTQNGHRSQRCLNVNKHNSIAVSNEAIKAISAADIIVVAPLLPTYPPGYLSDLLSHKRSKSLTVLLPQGYFRSLDSDSVVIPRRFSEAREIIPMFDLIIFSEDDCLSPEEEARDWAVYSNAEIIMTQGPDGASYITQKATTKVTTMAVPEKEIIDSVGCGDVFSAAVAHSYFLNRQVLPAIRVGNKAARAKLSQSNPNLI